jgi:hypothetical protein
LRQNGVTGFGVQLLVGGGAYQGFVGFPGRLGFMSARANRKNMLSPVSIKTGEEFLGLEVGPRRQIGGDRGVEERNNCEYERIICERRILFTLSLGAASRHVWSARSRVASLQHAPGFERKFREYVAI